MAIRTGTPGPDALEGTHEGDLIQGLAGNDLIDAASSTASPPNDGPDTVDGGAGNDTLSISSIDFRVILDNGATAARADLLL